MIPSSETQANTPGIDASRSSIPAIEIHDLHKIYNGFHAVDGLSVTVPQGCFFGFLGPNGAGKTTTIKMLMGLAQPNGGTMQVLGMPMPEKSLEIRREIGLVPDDTLLFDYLTGAEYLEFVARLYGLSRPLAKERGRELLDLFELSENRRKLIGEYSKGMRKRLAMGAALIHRPRLFLMDEPFEGVDAVGARLMKDILLEQVRHGATVFLTSHVLEVVERLCDQVAIIHRGKVLVQGTLSELREKAASGASTLEDIFVSLVGAERYSDKLDWL
ncbi:MAG: ABC transporter ATP-binding protein [Acidobacteriaceae bacterium]|nr:ABC transporter ATP-binding protein [Acidobacteriaceae bacterium]MBV9294749.1 ABC transporter ATP-binding protein [Acidobacteriaceae bacterium]MBV9764603.1 ABC transporter ATP-binding protein [Acidobacteriaceae bacterium]